MSTTNLFVELIVIGIGAFIWLVLLMLSIFGYAWVPDRDWLGLVAAVPALAFVYVLGIISDRVADALFQRIWTDDLRGAYFANRAEYYDARRVILTRSERLSELLEYGRSRLRICRGWTLNAILIGISLNVFMWQQLGDLPLFWTISIAGSALASVMALGSWFSWRELARNEYRKVREQAEFLAEGARTPTSGGAVDV